MSGRRQDYVLTLGNEILIMVLVVALFKVAAATWSIDGFAEFSFVRRVSNLVQLPLAIGVGLSVARYVSIAVAERRGESRGRYFAAALIVGLLPAGLFALAARLWDGPLAGLLFADRAYARDLAALGVLVAGLNAHTVIYGYLRGMLSMRLANALQLANKGAVPLLVFLVPPPTVADVFLRIGLIQLALSALAGLFAWRTLVPRDAGRWACRRELGELLRFGAVRIPGEFALAGLLGLPPIFVSHFADVRTAGLFAFGLSLLVMAGAAFSPLGLVMLPQLSAFYAAGEIDRIGTLVHRALRWALPLAAVGVAVFALLGDALIRLYLGEGYEGAVVLAGIVLWGAVPYIAYLILRNALDAVAVRPYNTKNLLLALALLLAAQPWVRTAAAAAWVLVGALGVLGVLSYWDFRRLLRRLPRKEAHV